MGNGLFSVVVAEGTCVADYLAVAGAHPRKFFLARAGRKPLLRSAWLAAQYALIARETVSAGVFFFSPFFRGARSIRLWSGNRIYRAPETQTAKKMKECVALICPTP